jgi:hypothetical protein
MTDTATRSLAPDSPFAAAQSRPKRLKVLAYGNSGTGKTTLALGFPGVALFDLEGGADLYSGKFRFDVLRTTAFDDAVAAVRWLHEHPHPYRTVVVAPITILWDALQKKWNEIFLRRAKSSKGYKFEYFENGPREWATIKAEWKDFMRLLLGLDTNLIVTAREKVLYSDAAFMQPAGFTFDGEKSLAYLFDVVLRLSRDAKGRFVAEVVKDRSGLLPTEPFEHSYALFSRLFGEETFTREAKPFVVVTDAQRRRLLDLIEELRIPQEQVIKRCEAYGAEGLHDISTEAAAAIIEKWAATLAARQSKNSTPTPKGD